MLCCLLAGSDCSTLARHHQLLAAEATAKLLRCLYNSQTDRSVMPRVRDAGRAP